MTDRNLAQNDPSEAELDAMIAERLPTMPPKNKSDHDTQAECRRYIPETLLRGRGVRSSDVRPKRRRANW